MKVAGMRSIALLSFILSAALPLGHGARATPTYAFVGLDPTDGSGVKNRAVAINNSGQVVGHTDPYYSSYSAFLRDSNGSFSSIRFPAALGPNVSFHGLNDAGQTVGIDISGSGFVKNVVTGAYSTFPGPVTAPYELGLNFGPINNAGQVLGSTVLTGAFGSLIPVAFVFDPATGQYAYFTPSRPPGNVPHPIAINNVGQALVQFGYANALLDLATGVFTLLSPVSTVPSFFKGNGTVYLGLNDLGQTVGYYQDPLNNYQDTGFIRDPNGSYTSLSYPGANGTSLNGINNAGQVIGIAYNPSGGYDFIATPVVTGVPEPATLALVGLGIVASTMAHSRRKTRTGSGLGPATVGLLPIG